MACVQCHDHPYDPIWHDEYYRFRNIFEPVQVAIDNGGGGPGGVDLAGVARIFDRNQNAVTKFYIRGNDRTPDEKRVITPGIPQVFGDMAKPETVQLPPQARIPHLREPIEAQTIARLEDDILRAERSVETARMFLVATDRRLASEPAEDVPPAQDALLVETFQSRHSGAWKMGPGQWENRDGHVAQTSAGDEEMCWLEYEWPDTAPRDFTVRLRLRITGGTKLREAGFSFDRNDKGGRNEGIFLTANAEKPGLGFFSEFDGDRNFSSDLFRDLGVPLQQVFVLEVNVRNRLVNVFVNDVLVQTRQLANREPGGFRLWTRDAAAEFHQLCISRLPEDVPLAPTGVIVLFAPIAQLAKSDPAHRLLARGVLEQSQLVLANHQAALTAHRATWAADAWKYLDAPATEDPSKEEVASHKKRHDELAIVAHRAQRQVSLHKAIEAQFLAKHELARAKTQAARGPEGDEKLGKAVVDAGKKLETASSQVEKTKKAIQEPPQPRYSGLPGSYGSSSGRRLALARWIADPQNPLTARVAVNHIWLRHFGRPLVQTVFDFGLSGQEPSHPELLDWLAAELQHPSLVLTETAGRWRWVPGQPDCKPWSMKHLHRLILTSSAYCRSSTNDPVCFDIDPDNLLLWRMPARRMDAETVRDSVLAAAGTLDRTVGGPDLPVTDGMSVTRRSLYFHHSPEDQMKFLKLFDGADPTECYYRHVSIVPHQALALFNSELTLVQSRKLAARLSREQSDTEGFIQTAFEQVLSRPATQAERQICRGFLAARESVYESQRSPTAVNGQTAGSPNAPAGDPRLHARENLIHSLFNHHDFVTVK